MIGHHESLCARLERVAGVFPIQHALDDERTIPGGAYPVEIRPGNGTVEIVRDPGQKITRSAAALQRAGHRTQAMRSSLHPHVPQPAWMPETVLRLIEKCPD